MELNELKDFKITPKLMDQLKTIGFNKSFKDGEVILNEHSYYFSFFTFISDRISDGYDCNLSYELSPTKIFLKAEMII